jgi:HSP20 family protein
VHETDKEVVVTAEIPGVEPTDLNVTVDELQITISGETKRSSERDEDGYRLKERRIGRFSRTVPLPAEVKPDEAWADYKHGVLEVRMNKAEQGRIRSRRLQINAKH